MNRVAALLQAAGLVSLTVAGWLVDPVLGFAVAGAGAVAVGIALEAGDD